jgi:hypothetical protein
VLVGTWHGELTQSTLAANVELQLRTSGKKVIGNAELRFTFDGKDRFLTLSLDGGFLYDRFLKLDYENTSSGTIQFGSIVLDLPAEPDKMTGRYVGYGSITGAIVSGQIVLSKRSS